MDFNPQLPDDGVNLPTSHPLVDFAWLVAGVSGVVVVFVLLLTAGVDGCVSRISPEREAAFFSELGAGESAQSLAPLVDRLASHWEEQPYPFHVQILEDDLPNALAIPGGHILVTEGLLKMAKSENELAMVLGHELGHFYHRHHIRRLSRGLSISILGSVLLGNHANTDLLSLSTQLTSRGFDRKQETAADRFGLELVQAEYGHINEAWRFFDRISANMSTLEGLSSYLSTHPHPDERGQQLRRWAEEEGWSLEGTLRPLPDGLGD